MHCRECHYPLEGLPGSLCSRPGQCPECGTPFDPEDPTSYESPWHGTRARRYQGVLTWAAAATPLAGAAWCLLTLAVARLQLGRWPNRGGMDDPKGIPVVSELTTLSCTWVLWVPLSGLLVLRMSISDLDGRRTGCQPPLWRSIVAIALWCAGVLVLLADPARTLVWIMD